MVTILRLAPTTARTKSAYKKPLATVGRDALPCETCDEKESLSDEQPAVVFREVGWG